MSITNQSGETPRDVARRFSKLACVKLLGRDPLLRGEQEEADGLFNSLYLSAFKLVFVAPALAVCNIGIHFLVRPSVRLSVHNLRRPWLLSPFK